ncbi:hypothetical protein NMYAN_320013 [Nitrosomonas nitrosa]|uniref:Uncharacterized protein n=1 Tax=Nitrosomonas nitrosa TaxID=52442 RepID=A0A8H8Z2K8_9PROT|nr:hypothetical protein NMYAN_320013 [Nitrosomonas nitrosa]
MKSIVVLQPHLREEVIVVQIMEEFVSQNFHPILIRTINKLNELTAPKVPVFLGFTQISDFHLHFCNSILSIQNKIILLHANLHV